MKQLFIFTAIALLCAAVSCKTQLELTQNEDGDEATALYSYWSVPVPGSGELEEKGIDLIITINHWKNEYEPLYVIFDERKSFLPELEELVNSSAVIKARVILESQLFEEVSEKSDLTDRLVYRRSDGSEAYIKIKKREEIRPE